MTLTSTTLFSEIELLSKVGSLVLGGTLATYGTYEAKNVIDIGAAASCYISCDYSFVGEDPFSLFSQIELFSLVQSLSGSNGADIVETGNGILIPAEGTTIQFAKHFHATPNVQVTILNKEQGDDEIISNPTTDSFDIVITNNEQPVQKTINYVVQGY